MVNISNIVITLLYSASWTYKGRSLFVDPGLAGGKPTFAESLFIQVHFTQEINSST